MNLVVEYYFIFVCLIYLRICARPFFHVFVYVHETCSFRMNQSVRSSILCFIIAENRYRSIFIEEKSPEIRHSQFDRHSHFKNIMLFATLFSSLIYENFNLKWNRNKNSAIELTNTLLNQETFRTWMTPILNQSSWNSKKHHPQSNRWARLIIFDRNQRRTQTYENISGNKIGLQVNYRRLWHE